MVKTKHKVYIHYGANHFDKNSPLTISRWDKPPGFWASPLHSKWGWKHFCISENFRLDTLSESFQFRLRKNAKILKIHRIEQIFPYLKLEEKPDYIPNSEWEDRYILDCEKIMNEFDGLELFMEKNYNYFHNTDLFYAWDVDSLVVWNLSKIVPLKNKK